MLILRLCLPLYCFAFQDSIHLPRTPRVHVYAPYYPGGTSTNIPTSPYVNHASNHLPHPSVYQIQHSNNLQSSLLPNAASIANQTTVSFLISLPNNSLSSMSASKQFHSPPSTPISPSQQSETTSALLSTRKMRLTDLPSDMLHLVMLHTMSILPLSSTLTFPFPTMPEEPGEQFLNVSDSTSLHDGLSLALTCQSLRSTFSQALTAVKLTSSWQAQQNPLIAACKIAAENLRAIHIECSAPVTAALREVIRLHPPIRHIVLVGVNISKMLMADIIFYVGPSLHKLAISAAPSLDSHVVDLIALQCTSLKSLELGSSRTVSAESLALLFEKIGAGLVQLDLNALHCNNCSPEILFALADNCISLLYLRFRKLRWVTDVGLHYLFSLRGYQLREFRLENCRATSAHMLCILANDATALQRLHCTFERADWMAQHPDSTDFHCENVAYCPLLSASEEEEQEQKRGSLPLTKGEKALVKVAHRCQNLSYLTLSDATISDNALNHLSFACGSSLRVLSLRHCSSLTNETLISLAKNSPNLLSLDLSFLPSILDDGLEQFLSLAPVCFAQLHIIGCRGLTDATVQVSLPKYGRNLRVVRLSYCNFSRHAMETMRTALPRLTICGTFNCSSQ